MNPTYKWGGPQLCLAPCLTKFEERLLRNWQRFVGSRGHQARRSWAFKTWICDYGGDVANGFLMIILPQKESEEEGPTKMMKICWINANYSGKSFALCV